MNQIVEELASTQGRHDLGGYYRQNADLVAKIMRPSATFNRSLANADNAVTSI